MRILLLAILILSSAAAQPLVVIQDIVKRADGTNFNGVLLIDWQSFTTPTEPM